MRLDKIAAGKWYRTKVGIGLALDTKKFRGMVQFRIAYPFPRGLVLTAPRDIEHEVESLVEGGGVPESWKQEYAS